jgi:cytochrome c553
MIAMYPAPKRMCVVRALALAVACTALAATTTASAKDEAGKKKADEACAACHGPEGNKPITPETPRLGGQHYGYLVQSLNAYRKGTRDNPIMTALAKPLTEKRDPGVGWLLLQPAGTHNQALAGMRDQGWTLNSLSQDLPTRTGFAKTIVDEPPIVTRRLRVNITTFHCRSRSSLLPGRSALAGSSLMR